jgi:hypothetical protein
MLYTCSTSATKKIGERMKRYYVLGGQENESVVPDKRDIDLFRSGVITQKGFALNYEMKLRGGEAYEWMARVSAEAARKDIVLVGEEGEAGQSYLKVLAEMMASMFGGKMNFRYMGELT